MDLSVEQEADEHGAPKPSDTQALIGSGGQQQRTKYDVGA
jgi:hypothetical protein